MKDNDWNYQGKRKSQVKNSLEIFVYTGVLFFIWLIVVGIYYIFT